MPMKRGMQFTERTRSIATTGPAETVERSDRDNRPMDPGKQIRDEVAISRAALRQSVP